MRINLVWRAGDIEKANAIFIDTQVKAKRLRGRGGLFEKWLAVIPGFIKKNFDSYGSRLGFSWRPLSPNYAKWKAIHYPGNPILVASGHMRMAATIPHMPGNWISWLGNVMLYGVDTSKFRATYPSFHQYGTTKMPERPYMGLATEDLEELTRIAAEHMAPRDLSFFSPKTIWTRTR